MLDQDLFHRYLADRGIRPETILANNIRLASPDETAKAVGEFLPSVCWSYDNSYQRYRFLGDPDLFPQDSKGKPIKCKARKGAGNRLYQPRHPDVSPEAWASMRKDTTVPLFVVEGEADCLGVLQSEPNALVVGISGCFGWKGKNDPILPELRELALTGRVVVLAPDSDWAHNRNVFKGWAKLGTVLKQIGCNVQALAIEADPDDKLGAGDYIVRFGQEEWAALDRVPLSDWVEMGQALHKAGEHHDDPTQEPRSKRESIAEQLVRLALDLGSFWHDSAGAGWVDFSVDGVLQTARIRSRRFKDFLSLAFWERENRSINSESWSQTVGTLEGLARFAYPEREAFLRIGQHEGSIYIDLGSPNWDIIQVTAEGWRITSYADCPVRFYRSDCQLPLPTPTRDGSLDDLWCLLNFRPEDRPLVLGWILSCFVPDGAKPILTLSGEKGGGKSTAATLLKRITDPTKVSKASTVGDERRMAAMASGRWVLSFDNLTHLSPEQQDLLCCVSTGAGFSHRTLYTDLEETFLEYRRPQILTGVDLVPTRSDLLDRSLIVRLDRILEENRLPESELENLTQELLPGIYGALLDLLATALRNLPTTRPAKLPRMADFALLCIAAGIPGFAEAYSHNIQAGCQFAIEANPVAAGILSLLESSNGYWQGSISGLLKALQEEDPSNRDFQKLSSRSLGRKIASSLRGDLASVGIEVDQGKSGGQRFLILTRSEAPKKTPQTPQTPYPAPGKAFGCGVMQNKTPQPNSETPQDVTAAPASGVIDPDCGVIDPARGVTQDKTPLAETASSKDQGVCGVSGVISAVSPDGKNADSQIAAQPVELDESELVEIPEEENEPWWLSCRPWGQ